MNNFKSKIDQLRDTLVGVTPNPSDQINQITYALIYKFMNDIDDESVELGGQRSYFAGEFAKYAWHELMRPRLEARQRVDLYREAIEKMSKNPGLPTLFQEIYKNAFLPFNNPATLDMFLKQIDKGFNHGDTEHNDDIGDAYEYLLQITGAQGNIGQFRTPRHIIKFIVDCVQPKATDTILDPAVGTAGFLIAAYNFIKSEHDGFGDNGTKNDETKLSADAKARLHRNFRGFDIDPTMVRTAQVNMYLHGFKTPAILSHDTLTSTDFWDDRHDVILANPPFMTPKGGIQPHKKFSVSAKKSEALFVDYINEHLKPMGRAGLIVPDGIVSVKNSAYSQLRSRLVQDSLYAVITLPSGVFKPYASVRTHILLLDKSLSKIRDSILFINISNDGFSDGTAKKPIEGSQLPRALETIRNYQKGKLTDSNTSTLVSKKKILDSTGHVLNGVSYAQISQSVKISHDIVKLGNIAQVLKGKSSSTKTKGGQYPLVLTAKDRKTADHYDFDGDAVLVPLISSTGHGKADIKNVHIQSGKFAAANLLGVILPDDTKVNVKYLHAFLDYIKDDIAKSKMSGSTNVSMNINDLADVDVILPSLLLQNKIAAEIENKQIAIDHAREIIKALERERAYFDPRPRALREGWPMRKLGEIFEKVTTSWAPTDKNAHEFNYYVGLEDIESGTGRLKLSSKDGYSSPSAPVSNKIRFANGDILYGKLRPNLNKVAYATIGDSICSTDFLVLHSKDANVADSKLFATLLLGKWFNEQVLEGVSGSSLPRVSPDFMLNIKVPVPPLGVQKEYAAAFATEQRIITANHNLMTLMAEKITNTLAEVWGDQL